MEPQIDHRAKNFGRGYVRQIPDVGFCTEKNRLCDELLLAIHEMNAVQSDQTQAVLEGDPDFSRFDVLLHLAREKKDAAKYAWLAHVEAHGCAEA